MKGSLQGSGSARRPSRSKWAERARDYCALSRPRATGPAYSALARPWIRAAIVPFAAIWIAVCAVVVAPPVGQAQPTSPDPPESRLSDFDGDGVEDWVFGDGCAGAEPARPGAVAIVSGRNGAVIDWIDGPQAGDLFGVDGVPLDDLNGDGVRELLILAPGYGFECPDAWGAAFVLDGGTRTSLRVHAGPEGEHYALDAAVGNDRNADGRRDYEVFSVLHASDGWEIAVKAVYCGATGDQIAHFQMPVVSPEDLVPLGDVNIDGAIDGSDVAQIIGVLGETGDGLLEDLSGDELVECADLAIAIEHVGGVIPVPEATPGGDDEAWPDTPGLFQDLCRTCDNCNFGCPSRCCGGGSNPGGEDMDGLDDPDDVFEILPGGGGHDSGADDDGDDGDDGDDEDDPPTGPRIDLDLDSDNNDHFNPPARSAFEGSIENDPERVGKIVFVNDDDQDADGLPGFADGFNSGPSADDDSSMASIFVPVVVGVAHVEDWEQALVTFFYPGGAPSVQTVDGLTYTPEAGAIRLWAKNGALRRSATGLESGGDFITPGVPYSLALLREAAGAGTEILLYLEAVRASTTPLVIAVTLDAPEGGDADSVQVAAVRTAWTPVTAGGPGESVEFPEVSDPAPIIACTALEVENVRASEDSSQILGDIRVLGSVTDAASDLIEGDSGTIDRLDILLNGEPIVLGAGQPPCSIQVLVSKTTDFGSIAAPYPYFGIFGETLHDEPLQPGMNLISLRAQNAHGFTGSASRGCVVATTPPADDLFEFRIQFFDQPQESDPASPPILSLVWNGQQQSPVPLTPAGKPGEYWGYSPVYGAVSLSILDPDPILAPGNVDSLVARIELPGLHSITRDVSMVETDADSMQMIGELTVIEPERPDWKRYQIALGTPTAIETTAAGGFNPVLFEIIGPELLFSEFGFAALASGDGAPAEYRISRSEGRSFLASFAHTEPRAFLLMRPLSLHYAAESPSVFETAIEPTLDRVEGFGAGMLDAGVALWDGVVGLGAFAWYGLKHYTPVSIQFRTMRGESVIRVEDLMVARAAMAGAASVVDVIAPIAEDGGDAVVALMIVVYVTLQQLTDKYRLAVSVAAPIMGAWWSSLSDFEKGQFWGRVAGDVLIEVTAALGSGGVSVFVTSARLPVALARIRSAAFVQRHPNLVSALDSLSSAATALATTRMCFVAGTSVLTPGGPRPIESIRAGDAVVSRDAETGQEAQRSVLKRIVTHPQRLVHICVSTAHGPVEVISSTPEHPFFVIGDSSATALRAGSWVAAEALTPGSRLLTAGGRDVARVEEVAFQIAPLGESFTTYNLEVADSHTYFVGQTGVWVHNASRFDCEQFRSVYGWVRERHNLGPYEALRRTLQEIEAIHGRRTSEDILGLAFHEVFDEIADAAVADPGNALALWPSFAQLKSDFGYPDGMLANTDLQVHHTFPKAWAQRYIHLVRGDLPSLNELDSMPGLPMHRVFHQEGQGLPGTSTFHEMLRQVCQELAIPSDPRDVSSATQIHAVIRETYMRYNTQHGQASEFDFMRVWQIADLWIQGRTNP